MEFSKGRVVFFSIQVCLACSILVAVAAVQLKDRQVANAALDRQKKVLVVAGLLAALMFSVGLILDTLARYHNETFQLMGRGDE